MNATQHIKPVMFSPLLSARIARRRLVLAWNESEYLQPFAIAALILLIVLAPVVYVFLAVW